MHQGEHIRQVIKDSGVSVTSLCKKLQKSRRWLYDVMQQPQVSVDVLLQLGQALHYNFIADFPQYVKFQYQFNSSHNHRLQEDDVNYWRDKYYSMLEQYYTLLEEKLEFKRGPNK
jgi:hypothetical protein